MTCDIVALGLPSQLQYECLDTPMQTATGRIGEGLLMLQNTHNPAQLRAKGKALV